MLWTQFLSNKSKTNIFGLTLSNPTIHNCIVLYPVSSVPCRCEISPKMLGSPGSDTVISAQPSAGPGLSSWPTAHSLSLSLSGRPPLLVTPRAGCLPPVTSCPTYLLRRFKSDYLCHFILIISSSSSHFMIAIRHTLMLF